MDFLNRQPDEEAYAMRDKWPDHRERLKHFYRNKMRRQGHLPTSTSSFSSKRNKSAIDSNGVDDDGVMLADGADNFETPSNNQRSYRMLTTNKGRQHGSGRSTVRR